MPDKPFRVLMLGDIVGRSGYRAVLTSMPKLVKRYSAEFLLINVENAADGFGVTEEIAVELFGAGFHVLTTGNHVWQRKEVYPYLDSEERILRPANYPGGNPGHGSCVVEQKGLRVGVLNLQGRVRMPAIDCPFRRAKEVLRKLKDTTDIVLVDFHAESTHEKEAFGHYLDGDVAVVVGTHTHIQTADERILPSGTAYISDMGACAPRESVIGFDPDISVDRMKTQLPLRNAPAETPAVICGVLVEVDRDSGLAVSVERVREVSLI
ncbi:MAG: TIGR00282 family metallophosphoesterase [Spirochaetaceae bacterium]